MTDARLPGERGAAHRSGTGIMPAAALYSGVSSRTGFAGFPATIVCGGTFFVTTDPAATIAP